MTTLHLRCGTDIRDTLRAAAIPGEFLEWADPVCQGPVLALPEPDYLERRRAWLSVAWDIPRAELDIKLQAMSSLPTVLERHAEVCSPRRASCGRGCGSSLSIGTRRSAASSGSGS
jgi:hypothetical protein